MNIIYDIEVYPNFFCLSMKKGDKYYNVTLDKLKLLPFKDKYVKWIGFNNRHYDHPIVLEALKGADNKTLYEMNRAIIENELQASVWEKNIIDLYEICPKMAKCSLKEMGHRMQYPHLENLPYPFEEDLTLEQQKVVMEYCVHDVKITALLWEKLQPVYHARQNLKLFFDANTEFGGEPRVAEKCLLSELGDIRVTTNKELIKKDNLILPDHVKAWYDEAYTLTVEDYEKKKRPSFMKTSRKKEDDGVERAQHFLDRYPEYAKTNYKVSEKIKDYQLDGFPDFRTSGARKVPDYPTYLNGCKAVFGVGGMHVFDKPGFYRNVYEYDVSSYYPSIILNCELGSAAFRHIYKKIYNQRFKLKAQGKKEEVSLKLMLNALYGKFLDQYADKQIYAPNLARSICLLGQFYIADLIEKLPKGTLILANTDSIVVRDKIDPSILNKWTNRTGFKLGCDKYDIYIAKDVNSVYAVREDGYVKRKKEFLEPVWDHNVRAPIIQRAVLNYLLEDKPIEDTFKESTTLYDYCFFVRVTGESKFYLNTPAPPSRQPSKLSEKEWLDQVELWNTIYKPMTDKKVRYYCSTEGDVLAKKTKKTYMKMKGHSKVTLAMDLKLTKPINYEWYTEEINKLIEVIQGE